MCVFRRIKIIFITSISCFIKANNPALATSLNHNIIIYCKPNNLSKFEYLEIIQKLLTTKLSIAKTENSHPYIIQNIKTTFSISESLKNDNRINSLDNLLSIINYFLLDKIFYTYIVNIDSKYMLKCNYNGIETHLTFNLLEQTNKSQVLYNMLILVLNICNILIYKDEYAYYLFTNLNGKIETFRQEEIQIKNYINIEKLVNNNENNNSKLIENLEKIIEKFKLFGITYLIIKDFTKNKENDIFSNSLNMPYIENE